MEKIYYIGNLPKTFVIVDTTARPNISTAILDAVEQNIVNENNKMKI